MPTWSKSGNVTLAASSDPFALTGTMGESSLRLRSGGWVRTPLLCVDLLTPHLRLVATATGYGELEVETRLIGCPQPVDHLVEHEHFATAITEAGSRARRSI